ncbi:peptidyl-prolyl cis-trans isomerase FKBP4-like [Paramacrobiotus metropolitanus]|uniref:peptidyl-prolyl cis-trans isomerase FKBP4-like n=1 Tax=Paramacrobiotus metropolitanus TaxID=2943436 RepID=UPI0024464C3E|nr:peptidyl-prolyl cis-trans isomerase FKBP4-like [Paramacrobiotus metropolitanus]XP_055336625.1 peptidyl-prolyl cis-trans isomerase FKBP4-like [Paramacrobiotus metropolitanus]
MSERHYFEDFDKPMEKMPVDFDIEDPALLDCSDKQDRGVLKKIIKEGTGTDTPFDGSTVHVHYIGRLVDGSVFDSSRKRNEPFKFILGKRKVIQAWDWAVSTMKKGEICEMVCKSAYAYGKIGSPPKIPPNSTLIFQVELLSWDDEDLSAGKDKKILRRLIRKGTGYTMPNENAKTKVRLCGLYEGRKFDEREVEFYVDEGDDDLQLIPGIDLAVKKMKKHECSLFTFHPDVAFGREGKPEWEIPGNAEVRYEITLLDFDKAKDTWSMNPDEKFETAERSKEKGSQAFTKGRHAAAIKHYERMKEMLAADAEFKDENEEKRKKMLAVSHNNLAAVHLKLGDLYAAKRATEEALTLDPNNIKGLYRKGTANFGLRDYEEAKRDFQRIVDLEPENKAAKQQLALLSKEMRAQADKDRKRFQGMFDKFAAEDSKGDNKPEVDVKTNGSGSGDGKAE